ncbi:hypothetical protein CLV71_108250 [Actinophytocola oryzae]|uniref:Uncharacterized protein n=1 Tax=Actinophytocola oryzae TaxID=502181 RepID=A0A4R7VIF6_9PSEU|nr:hypothetical protein CLV71_108250 [Actinophytocola oryzae]
MGRQGGSLEPTVSNWLAPLAGERAFTRRLPSCARKPLGSYLAQELPCSSVQTPAAHSQRHWLAPLAGDRAFTRRLPSCARKPLGSYLAQELPCSSVQTPAAHSQRHWLAPLAGERAFTRRLPSCARKPLGSYLAQELPCSSVQTPAAHSRLAWLHHLFAFGAGLSWGSLLGLHPRPSLAPPLRCHVRGAATPLTVLPGSRHPPSCEAFQGSLFRAALVACSPPAVPCQAGPAATH